MLLVNPNARSNTDLPNMALAYAATAFNAKVVDFNTMPEPAQRLYNQETDILAISFQSRSYTQALTIKKKYLERYPQSAVKSISGCIDIQCCYPFLTWDESILFDKQFSDELPFPNYELFDSFRIFQKNWSTGTWPFPILTSLGCPFPCTYCMSHNRAWHPRTPENCFTELQQAQKQWGIKSFTIMDDCFNLKKDRVIEFCKQIKKLNIEWFCTNGLRADRFDADMAMAMAQSGCTTVGFGIESSDPAVLQSIKKGESVEQIGEAVHIAKKYFKSVSGYFIIGLPGSSFESDKNTLKWALNAGLYPHFSLYVPFDKAMQYDSTFYGDNVKPTGTTYKQELQQTLYNLTRGLSWGGVNRNISAVIKNRLSLLFTFGPFLFAKYILLDFKKAANTLRRRLR